MNRKKGDATMRFMNHRQGHQELAGAMPEEKLIAEMAKYHEALAKAGALAR